MAGSRPKPLLTPVMSQVLEVMSVSFRGCGRGLVDGGEGVEGAGVADERQQHGEHADQRLPVVADVEVGCDVAADLDAAPTRELIGAIPALPASIMEKTQ